jgi:hypothetical protein
VNQLFSGTLIELIKLVIKIFTDFSFNWYLQGLFRNFDNAVLDLLKPHVEQLVADTAHDTHETSQRCAAEIISGLIRGSKHWSYEKVISSIIFTNFDVPCQYSIFYLLVEQGICS